MAAFFEQLWESIFTPGPTPTLLVATNASFAALQVLLFVMLLATYSIHFVILSILCGGLWWSINWFATEIRAAQAKEEEAKRIREARRSAKGKGDDGDGEAMDSGDDTEVDTEVEQKQAPKSKPTPPQPRAARPEAQSTVFVERPEGSSARSTPQPSAATAGSQGPATTTTTTTTPAAAAAAASTTGTATGLAVPADETVKRRKGMAESVGDLSTDSEWDKLSEDSEDR